MSRPKSQDRDFINHFDRLPTRERFFSKIKELFSNVAAFYGFEHIHTSLLENPKTLLPVQRAGFLEERLPIICKTPAGVDLALRPAGILGVLRGYISHKLNDLPHPLKFLFQGESFFLYNNRSAGTQIRSLPEWGVCMIGEEGPIGEAEIIQVMWKSFERAGIDTSALDLKINATGCSECRPSFRSGYMAHFRPRAHRLCKYCKKYLKRAPIKILSCEEDQCHLLSQNAPQVLDYLCEVCKKHLRGVLEFLDEAKISYFLEPRFFKDGSLYSSLIFEYIFKTAPPTTTPIPLSEIPVGQEVNEQPQPAVLPVPEVIPAAKEIVTLAEGGRVSRVGELMVGRRLDVVAGAVMLGVLEEILVKKGMFGQEKPKVFLTQLGDLAKRKSLGLIESLRAGGITVQESLGRDSVKSQLKVAERVGAEIALILGQKEALDNTIIVREINSGIQETVSQEKLVEFLKRKLRK